MMLSDPHLFRPSRKRLWEALACKVEKDPSCLSLPLSNIDRWLARGRIQTAPLIEWRSRLLLALKSPQSLNELIVWMKSDNHDSEPLKSCSPFPGLLTDAELQALKAVA